MYNHALHITYLMMAVCKLYNSDSSMGWRVENLEIVRLQLQHEKKCYNQYELYFQVWAKISPKLQILKSKVTSVTGAKLDDMVNLVIILDHDHMNHKFSNHIIMYPCSQRVEQLVPQFPKENQLEPVRLL